MTENTETEAMGNGNQSKVAAVLVEAIRLLDEQDMYLSLEYVESETTPEFGATCHEAIVGQLFERRDIPTMIGWGRAAVQACLAGAKDATAEQARELRRHAKILAFNTAANTWPGWGDEGVTLNRTDVALGLDLARVSLRLVEELDLDAAQRGRGTWLVAALLLALDKVKLAMSLFEDCVDLFQQAEDRPAELMAAAYCRMTQYLGQQGDAAELAAAIDVLAAEGSADAGFYAEQVRCAAGIFLRKTQ